MLSSFPLDDVLVRPFIVPDMGFHQEIDTHIDECLKLPQTASYWQNSQSAIIGVDIMPGDESKDPNEFYTMWENAIPSVSFISELRLKNLFFKQISIPRLFDESVPWPLNSDVSVFYKSSRGIRVYYRATYVVEDALIGAAVTVALSLQVW